jgi:hypothetical protein
MPEIPETAELEVLISALIRQASDRLQRQLNDVRRQAEGAHKQARELHKNPVRKRAKGQKKQHA